MKKSLFVVLVVALSSLMMSCDKKNSTEPKSAEEFYTEACESIDAANYEDALVALQQAADLGLAQAQFVLGGMYANGMGVDQDYATAAVWYLKAAEQGHGQARYELSQLYAEGRGVPEDAELARMWLEKAAEVGYMEEGV